MAATVALLGGARLPAAGAASSPSLLLPRRNFSPLRLQDAPRLSLLLMKASSDDTSTAASGDELIEDLKAKSVRKSRRRVQGSRQSLVSVGTPCGGGHQWSSDFDLTLRQLHLNDLIEDSQNDADVLVHVQVQQHTQFGMSIKGRVITSFKKICDSCSSPYCAKIDEQFNLTVLSSTRKEQSGMPDIGDSDPSVIYVKPGVEVDLDPVIQETIRLTASAKSSCSEACEKSTVVWQYDSSQKQRYSQRWSKLLDLKRTLDKAPN